MSEAISGAFPKLPEPVSPACRYAHAGYAGSSFSPCGRRWRGRSPRRMRGLSPLRQTPHPSRTRFARPRHPIPQGERGRRLPRRVQNALGRPACRRPAFRGVPTGNADGHREIPLCDRAVPDFVTAAPLPNQHAAGGAQQLSQLASRTAAPFSPRPVRLRARP